MGVRVTTDSEMLALAGIHAPDGPEARRLAALLRLIDQHTLWGDEQVDREALTHLRRQRALRSSGEKRR